MLTTDQCIANSAELSSSAKRAATPAVAAELRAIAEVWADIARWRRDREAALSAETVE
jgi:hypothetical protein